MNTKEIFHGHDFTIDKLAQDVVQLLCRKSYTLSTAESCTGGMVSAAITGVPGSSGVFGYGLVTYANEAKINLLGVGRDILARRGAVSRETAEAMAGGVRALSGSNIGAAITGIAGPGGGTSDKPVGTVYVCVAGEDILTCELFNFNGTRQEIRQQSVISLLRMIKEIMA